MADEDSTELAAMADGQEGRFNTLMQALIGIIQQLLEKKDADKQVFLQVQREDLLWYRSELLDCFEQIANPRLRFDIAHYICELVEEAFAVASKAGLTPEDLDAARVQAAKDHGASGGRKAALSSRMRSERWQDRCLERAKQIRGTDEVEGTDETLSTNNWARLVFKAVKPDVNEGTVLKALQSMEADGRLQRKKKKS